MQTPKVTGFARLYHASRYSMKGFKAAFTHEPAFKYEVIAALVLIPSAIFVADNALQLAALIGVVLLVLTTELINSAVEAVVDRVGLERHELAGRAKDLGSAAVFMTLIIAALTWVSVIYHNHFG